MGRRKKKTSFWDIKQGCKNVAGGLHQAGIEYSSIATYAGRELMGQPHTKKVKCTLKKQWFD